MTAATMASIGGPSGSGSSLARLRRRTGDLRVHAEVVQRAGQDSDGYRPCFSAVRRLGAVIMTLGASNHADDQPDHEQNRRDFHDLPPARRMHRASRDRTQPANYLDNRRLNAPLFATGLSCAFQREARQPAPAAMQSRQHSAGLALHDPSDLAEAEALEAGNVYGHAEVIGKLPPRLRDADIRHMVQGDVLRGAHALCVCDWTRASWQVLDPGSAHHGLALPVPAAADERARQGAIQPSHEVRPVPEPRERRLRPGHVSWAMCSASARWRVIRAASGAGAACGRTRRSAPPGGRGGRGADARSMLDVFLRDLRGCGRGIPGRGVLPCLQVVCGQHRIGLIPGLRAVALLGEASRVDHDIRGQAGFVHPTRDRAAQAPAQDCPPPQPALLTSAGKQQPCAACRHDHHTCDLQVQETGVRRHGESEDRAYGN